MSVEMHREPEPAARSNGARPGPDQSPTDDARRAVEGVIQTEWSRLTSGLVRACGGDFQLAEDALQDALLAGLERWPRDGVPAQPSAWLLTTARRKAIDRLRRDQTLRRKRELLGQMVAIEASAVDTPGPVPEGQHLEDDRLRLIFTCCHPALSRESQIALTLRTVAGLETAEIARAFLVPVETMSKRLVRARRKIADERIPYRVPAADELPERLANVLRVVYLIFNEGYVASSGDALVRQGMCDEAIRLGRLIVELVPSEPEALGLLALMLLIDSRRRARTDEAGDLVPLEEQDRALWDRGAIAEGIALVERALGRRPPGFFQLQAAIAALHAEPLRPEDADWRQIGLLYAQLLRIEPSPVVALNRAVAVGMADGPAAGLRLIEGLEREGTLAKYHLLHAARADLLRRARNFDEAATAYRRALALCTNPVEVRYLERRLAEVTAAGGAG